MEYDIEGERRTLKERSERETIRVEKGAVRETEGGGEGGSEKEREREGSARGVPTERERREANRERHRAD